MSTHQQILDLVKQYSDESEKFEVKGVKASAGRARKKLSELSKLCKTRRAEIQTKKEEMVKE